MTPGATVRVTSNTSTVTVVVGDPVRLDGVANQTGNLHADGWITFQGGTNPAQVSNATNLFNPMPRSGAEWILKAVWVPPGTPVTIRWNNLVGFFNHVSLMSVEYQATELWLHLTTDPDQPANGQAIGIEVYTG